jgi:cell division protein FtsA
MSNKNQIVAGLDIGTTKIAAFIGRRTEYGKIEILGMGKAESTGVIRGVVSHITPTVDAIKRAIEIAQEKAGFEVKLVNVGIAGQHIKSLQHRGVRMRDSFEDEITHHDLEALREDMYKLVMLPGEEIIDVLPQEYAVDNEQGIKDPIGMSGIRLEGNFHIITGQIAAVRNIYKCVTKAGLEVSDLTLEPLASSQAVLSEEEKEAGVALIDIGGGTTDIAIFQDGIIRHTAVIPFGGNVITEDIRNGCSILRKQAELLKVKFGSALASQNQENDIVVIPGLKGRDAKEISVKNLSHIIQARMEEIIEQVYYEIRNSGFEKKLIGGAVISGGGAQLKHIAQLFEYITGMDARIGYPTEYLLKGTDEVTCPASATGVGLVLRAVKNVEYHQQINKTTNIVQPEIPTEIIEKKNKVGIFDRLLGKTKEWLEDE